MAQSHTQSATYRPDIDGLRAIAVLAVLIFHIDEGFLPGGFAGVDVFFVISGFLITGNIVRGIDGNKFTFAEFYRRRILRILPPLIVVLMFTMIVGHLLFLPEDLERLAWSALASILSVANLYFYQFLDTSYFAADASVHPLLHLWSLGVEEQFYIFWPFLLLWLTRLRGGLALTATLGLAVLSFGFAELVVQCDAMFAYYMLPARAGQLMAGAAVFWAVHYYRDSLAGLPRLPIALLGLILMVGSLIFVSAEIPYPGKSALPVTLGTALLVLTGSLGDDVVKRGLGNRFFVQIGLISYSLYLWHWPVFAFYKYFYGHFSLLSGSLATVLVFALTWATYVWVEQPLRRWKAPIWPVLRNVFVLPSLLIAVATAGISATSGFGFDRLYGNYPDRLAMVGPVTDRASRYPYICQKPRLAPSDLDDPACVINSETEPRVLMWGDSNAAHYVGMLGAFAQAEGFGFRNIAHSSCPPFLQNAEDYTASDRRENCGYSANLVASVAANYDVVILSASWPGPLRRADYSGREQLRQTITELTGRGTKVIILGKIPIIDGVDSQCAQKAVKVPFVDCTAIALVEDDGELEANEFLASLAAENEDASFISFREHFCNGATCSSYLDNRNSYYDPGHLNVPGSWALGRKILREGALPDAFSALLSTPLAQIKRTDLEAYLETRFHGQFDAFETEGREVLIGGDNLTQWRGNAIISETANGIVFEDASDEKFRFHRLSISPSEFVSGGGDKVLVRVVLSSNEGGIPLLRLRTTGAERKFFDLMLDLDARLTKLKKELTHNNVEIEYGDEDDVIYFSADGLDPAEPVELLIYPASSDQLGAYDDASVGKVTIRSIKVIVQ